MYNYSDELQHHGVKGQRWGVRRYQNKDGSLTKAGKRRLQKIEAKDSKWAKKNYDKIYNKAYKSSKREMADYVDDELSKSGKQGKHLINEYNKKLAQVMNTKVNNIQAPSGRIVQFIAKRGEVGVHMALADASYDMSEFKNGVYGSGKIAYKKKEVDKI